MEIFILGKQGYAHIFNISKANASYNFFILTELVNQVSKK